MPELRARETFYNRLEMTKPLFNRQDGVCEVKEDNNAEAIFAFRIWGKFQTYGSASVRDS